MDIYSYINSKAIADHCRKINHIFSPLDTAYLIYASQSHTLPEKYEAWNELIETMPDMELKGRRWTPHFDSLHEFLKQHMQIQRKYIDMFYQNEPDCIYSYEVLYSGDERYCEDDRIYSNFASCYDALKADIDDLVGFYTERKSEIDVLDIRVTKRWINNAQDESSRSIKLCIDYNNAPVEIRDTFSVISDDDYDILNAFEGLWPEIPTPFRKGDILIDNISYLSDKIPFVLEDIPYWDEDGQHQKVVNFLREEGDSSDLITSIYGIDKDGSIWHGHGPSYLNLEYCDKPLEGTERILTAISNHLKGELSFEYLLLAYEIMKGEADVKEKQAWMSSFIDEIHIKAGLKDKPDAEEPY